MTGRAARAAVTVVAILAAAAGCAAPAATTAAPAAPAAPATTAAPARHRAAKPAANAARTAQPAQTADSCDPDASSLAPSSAGASVTPGSWAARIKARGELIAGVDQSTYHFGFLNPIDGKIEGFDIAMVDAVAQAIFGSDYARHIEFKSIPDADRVPAIRSGAVDLVAHTMTVTCDRLRQIDFSSVYYNAHARLMVLKTATPPSSLAGLKGQKACATAGSDDGALIRRYGATLVQVPYWTDCLVDLQQGQVAGIVTDDSILHGLAAQDPFTTIVGGDLEAEPYGLGISKTHPDFVRFVNAVLAKIESDGQWEQDYRRWVGGPAQSPPTPRYSG